ncbi:DNA repair protein RecO [Rickettsiales bacterium]|nr:DNA repair protein RecO [Rickettsiales bacterium]
MQWNDNAFVLTNRIHGENSSIVSIFTRNHGVFNGLVRGAKNKKNRALYQPGNFLQAQWKARLSEQLGSITAEPIKSFSTHIMQDPLKLVALQSASILTYLMVPERDPHAHLYDMFENLIEEMVLDGKWQSIYIFYEMELLSQAGFGLDLSCCAATGSLEDLFYISPKTGRAVSKNAGKPYHDKLILLPEFILNKQIKDLCAEEINKGLALCGYFLNKYIFKMQDKKMPDVRLRLAEIMPSEELV